MPLTTTDDPPAFRPAVPEDVPAIVALLESAYRGEASRAGAAPVPLRGARL